jgi:DNA-binding MarR family transcriptional regulator
MTMAASAASTPESQIRLAVVRLSRRLRQQTAGEVTASQLSALETIARHREVSLGDLAAIERIAPPSMTRVAARLEERGLVERRIDASDRRVARLALSLTGEALLVDARTRRDAFLAGRLQDFDPKELALLAAAIPLLERLASEGA